MSMKYNIETLQEVLLNVREREDVGVRIVYGAEKENFLSYKDLYEEGGCFF